MYKNKKYCLITLLLLTILFTLITFTLSFDKIILRCEVKRIESKINQIISYANEYIECSSMTYYDESKEIRLYFKFEDYNKDNELEGMCKIADYVSQYIKNNPDSFLCWKKITLGSGNCDRLGDIKICNFDPATNESFSSSEQFDYGYFDGYFYNKEDFLLSKLENFNWFEILEFTSDTANDDYSILLEFQKLKEIRCNSNFFTKTEMESLRSHGIFIFFENS